jgi:GNAT superfamily N-acetyltransferase
VPNPAEILADAFRGHGVDLTGLEEHERRQVLTLLDDLQRDLVSQLSSIDPSDPSAVTYKQQRLFNLLKQTRETINGSYADITKQQAKDMRRLAELESLFANNAVNQALGFNWSDTQLTAEQLRAIASNVLIEGSPARDWWRGQRDDLQRRFEREIRMGMMQGESIDEMVRRVRGKSDGTFFTTTHPKTGKKTRVYNFQGGVMAKSTREATALTRTSVAAVAAEARFQSFVENNDVVKGVQQISMMDGRTSEICLAYANKTFVFEESDLKRAGKTYRETQAGVAKKRKEARGGMTRFNLAQQLAMQVAAGYPIQKGAEFGWHKLKKLWDKNGWEFPSLPSGDIKLLPASTLGGQTIDATWKRLLEGPGDSSYPIVPWSAVQDEVMEGDYGEQLFWGLLAVRALEKSGDISTGLKAGTAGGFRTYRPTVAGTPLFISQNGLRGEMLPSQADYVPFPFVLTGEARIADLSNWKLFDEKMKEAQTLKMSMINEILGSPVGRTPEMIEEMKFLQGLPKEQVLALFLKDQGYTGAIVARSDLLSKKNNDHLILINFDDDNLRMLDGPSTQFREIHAHRDAIPLIHSPEEMAVYREVYRDLAPVATDDRWWNGEIRFEHVYDDESAYQEAAAIVQEAIRMEVLFPEVTINNLRFNPSNSRRGHEINWLGWYHHDIEGESGTINVNTRYMEDIGGISEVMSDSARIGWHPIGAEFVQSLYTHEFAHGVHNQLQLVAEGAENIGWERGALLDEIKTFNKWLKESRLAITAGDVSDYAKKDDGELFAETFELILTVPREYWSEFAEEFYERLDNIIDLDARMALAEKMMDEYPEIFGTFYPEGKRFFLSEVLMLRKYAITKPNYIHSTRRPDLEKARGHDQFMGLTTNIAQIDTNEEAYETALEMIGEMRVPGTTLHATNFGWELRRGELVVHEFGRQEMKWLMDLSRNRLENVRLPESLDSQLVYSGFRDKEDFLHALSITSTGNYNLVESALEAFDGDFYEAIHDPDFQDLLKGMDFNYTFSRYSSLDQSKIFERTDYNYLLYVDTPEGTPFLYTEAFDQNGDHGVFIGGRSGYKIRDVQLVVDDVTGEARTALYLTRSDQPLPKETFGSAPPSSSAPLYATRDGWEEMVRDTGLMAHYPESHINTFRALDELIDEDFLDRVYSGEALSATTVQAIRNVDEIFNYNNPAQRIIERGQDISFGMGKTEFLRYFFNMGPHTDLDDLYGKRGTNTWFTEGSLVKSTVDNEMKWLPEWDDPVRVIIHSDLEDPYVIPGGDFALSGRVLLSRQTQFEVTGIDFDGKTDVIHLRIVSQTDPEDLPDYRQIESKDALTGDGKYRIVSGDPESVHDWAVQFYSHKLNPQARQFDDYPDVVDEYADRTALVLYRQDGGDKAINVPLRTGGPVPSDIQELIDDLDYEFARPETKKLATPLTLWRGVSRKHWLELFFPEGRPDIPIDDTLLGIKYTDPGFPSTGLLKGPVLEQFTHKERILLQIQAPDGTPVIYMDSPDIGPNRMSEFEFLLNRDHGFEIIDTGMVGDREMVTVRLLLGEEVPLPNRPKDLTKVPPHQAPKYLAQELGRELAEVTNYDWRQLNYGLVAGRSNLTKLELGHLNYLDTMLKVGGRIKGPLVIEKLYTPEMLVARGMVSQGDDVLRILENVDPWDLSFQDPGFIRGKAFGKGLAPLDSGSTQNQITFKITVPEKAPGLLEPDGVVNVGRGHTLKPISFDPETNTVHANLVVRHREPPSPVTFVEDDTVGFGIYRVEMKDEKGFTVGKLDLGDIFDDPTGLEVYYKDYLYVKGAYITDSEYLGKGLGRELYRAGASYAAKKGYKGIWSDTDRSSMATRAWKSIPEAELQPNGFYILRPRVLESVPEPPSTKLVRVVDENVDHPELIKAKGGKVLVSDIIHDFEGDVEVDFGGLEVYYDEAGNLTELSGDLRLTDPEGLVAGRYMFMGNLHDFDPDMVREDLAPYGAGWVFSHDIRLTEDYQGIGLGKAMYRVMAHTGAQYGFKGVISGADRSPSATYALRALEEHIENPDGVILLPARGSEEAAVLDFSQTTMNLAQWNAMGESQRAQKLLQLGRSHPALQGIDLWKSVERYQSMAYSIEGVKRALRNGWDNPTGGKTDAATFLSNLDAMTKTFGDELYEDISLYRGISLSGLENVTQKTFFSPEDVAGLVGTEFTDNWFVSCSLSKWFAEDWAEVLLEVEVPAGTPGVYANAFLLEDHPDFNPADATSGVPFEDRLDAMEYFLGRGLTFKFIAHRMVDGRHILTIRVIEP